jgi:hypothetical protein
MGIISFAQFVQGASRKTAILDTNLLILHVTANVDLQLINSFKRVKSNFVLEDVEMLAWVLDQFAEIVTTSYVLTEASNLGNGLTGRQRDEWFKALALYSASSRETHVSTTLLGTKSETVRFGFADSALHELSEDSVVITAEYRLSGYLEDRNAAVLNFNHLRPLWMMR